MRLQLLLLATAACFAAVCTQTFRNIIDTSQPIVRRAPGMLNPDAYFGYSMVLHKIRTDETDMASALSNTRIIVGAPRGSAPGTAVLETGLIYTCPVNPGPCSGLTGGSDPDDARLFDTAPNALLDGDQIEEKRGQFMGVSLASSGDQFIACAHRYVNFRDIDPLDRHPFGRCFFSGRDLEGFTEFQPCDGVGVRATFSVGVCQAGTSAALVRDTDGDTSIGVGAPGTFSWRGIVIRRSPGGTTSFGAFGDGTDLFSYQGYSMTKGRLVQSNREDFAVSVPRFNLYTGQVNIVVNSNQLTVVSQGLTGTQMGEYFGFSLVALDLTGDNLDELLVGAPMYRSGRNADAGRVFIYSNTGGSLAQVGMLVGSEAFGRFGYAMANLGDISGDGLDDVAISAPFDSDGGTVFIYHSAPSTSLLLTATPQQTITASSLSLSPTISSITGFGTALASGVDVDGNSYNDLAISSFETQEVFLLRSRPVAQVSATMTATPSIVDIEDRSCMLDGTDYSCFRLQVCLSYNGLGVSPQLTLNVTILADERFLNQGREQRLFFDNPTSSNVYSTDRDVNINQQDCDTVTVFVVNGITDIFTAFTIDLSVSAEELNVPVGDGNDAPVDFSTSPFVSLSGTRALPVAILNDCGDPCTPDLEITLGAVSYTTTIADIAATQLTAGLVSSFSVPIDVENLDPAHDAFVSVISFDVPRRSIVFDRLDGTLTACEEEMGADISTWTCGIGNPFSRGAQSTFTAFFSPTSAFTGAEGTIEIPFTLSSLNAEEAGDEANNVATLSLQADARADISLDDPAIISPPQVSFGTEFPVGEIENVTQLGAGFDAAFVVRNSGPSTVPEIELDIFWPLNGPETLPYYFLYTSAIMSSGSGTVQCDTTNINPEGIAGSSITDEGFETESGGQSAGGGRRRRRRRSVPKGERLIVKRQDGEVEMAGMDRTLECDSVGLNGETNCVRITCSILQLPRNGRVEINVIGFIDERFFAGSVDRYSFITSASVRIVNGAFITQPQNDASDVANAQLRVIPAINTRQPPSSSSSGAPWYAIAIPIIVGLLVIVIVAVLLWRLGFFRRKKHEELKKRQEENAGGFSNSTENIIDAAGGPSDGTNL